MFVLQNNKLGLEKCYIYQTSRILIKIFLLEFQGLMKLS